jgi:hypothetical protein
MPGLIPLRRSRDHVDDDSDIDASSPSSDKRPRLDDNASQVLSSTLPSRAFTDPSVADSSPAAQLRKRSNRCGTPHPLTWLYRQSRHEGLCHIHVGRISSWSQLEHDHWTQRHWKKHSGLCHLSRSGCQTRRPWSRQRSLGIRQTWPERGRD